MRVGLTGATGFVGGHTLVALMKAGHEPVALVRSADKLSAVAAMHGVAVPRHHVGDVTNAVSVQAWLNDCEAVIHAAAVAHISRKHRRVIEQTNVAATRLVVGGAADRGLDPIVHVSSNSALHPPPGGRYTPDSPLSPAPVGVYARSKVESERIARQLQIDGHPVTIVWPGGIYGPDDVGLSVTAAGTVRLMQARTLPITSGGNLIVDVRDVATVLAACIEPHTGPRRFGAFGHFLNWSDMAALVDDVAGSKLRTPKIPGGLMRTLAVTGDLVERLGFEATLDRASANFMTTLVPGDSSGTAQALGLEWRPAAETMRDSIRWLVEAGHLKPKYAPLLA